MSGFGFHESIFGPGPPSLSPFQLQITLLSFCSFERMSAAPRLFKQKPEKPTSELCLLFRIFQFFDFVFFLWKVVNLEKKEVYLAEKAFDCFDNVV